ncbi:MAG: sugar ABC transporter substrate-binding protein [Treponema sp.]|jgi:ABC-type sugar transport system substrate-binding protein|nr:sugar ABC transporter substrate-binding protein [Treponema sp.]
MKKAILLLLCVFMIGLPLFAKGGEDKSGGKDFVIAFANVNDVFPYLVKVRSYVQQFAGEKGIKVLVGNADSDLNKQVDQIENFLVQGAKVIICVPADPDGIAPTANKCWAQGVPFFTVCGNTTGTSVHVGSLNYDAGVMQATYLKNTLPQGGKVLYQHADPVNQEYRDRRDGFFTLFKDRPDLELLAEQNTVNRGDLGMSVTETWLQQYPKFDAIVAQNDDSALGAIEALKAANVLKNVKVVGLDGSDPALESIQNGEMAATAFQNARGQAQALVALVERYRSGENPKSFQNVAIPFEVITKQNVSQFIGR